MSKSQLSSVRHLRSYLIEAIDFKVNWDSGLCYCVVLALPASAHYSRDFMKKCFAEWTETTGSMAYPIHLVDYPEWSQADQFDAVHASITSRTLSDNGLILADFPAMEEYRAARIRLAKFIINRITEEIGT
jgi:hypothetical protein